MAHATTKAMELVSPKATLTPCILDDNPAQLDLLTEQVAILGYEAIPTSDPEEALRPIRTGRCRMVFADVHTPGMGSPEVRQVNVRLIAATNRDLRAEVLAGRFREDLYYRLSSIQIRIPSLAERLEDIPLLTQFFLKKYNDAYGKKISGLTRRAQTAMLQHPWPGNVRALENVISSASITATGEFVDLADLSEQLKRRSGLLSGREDWRPLSLDEVRATHSKGAGSLQRKPAAGRADPGNRPHKPLPLSKAGWRRAKDEYPNSARTLNFP